MHASSAQKRGIAQPAAIAATSAISASSAAARSRPSSSKIHPSTSTQVAASTQQRSRNSNNLNTLATRPIGAAAAANTSPSPAARSNASSRALVHSSSSAGGRSAPADLLLASSDSSRSSSTARTSTSDRGSQAQGAPAAALLPAARGLEQPSQASLSIRPIDAAVVGAKRSAEVAQLSSAARSFSAGAHQGASHITENKENQAPAQQAAMQTSWNPSIAAAAAAASSPDSSSPDREPGSDPKPWRTKEGRRRLRKAGKLENRLHPPWEMEADDTPQDRKVKLSLRVAKLNMKAQPLEPATKFIIRINPHAGKSSDNEQEDAPENNENASSMQENNETPLLPSSDQVIPLDLPRVNPRSASSAAAAPSMAAASASSHAPTSPHAAPIAPPIVQSAGPTPSRQPHLLPAAPARVEIRPSPSPAAQGSLVGGSMTISEALNRQLSDDEDDESSEPPFSVKRLKVSQRRRRIRSSSASARHRPATTPRAVAPTPPPTGQFRASNVLSSYPPSVAAPVGHWSLTSQGPLPVPQTLQQLTAYQHTAFDPSTSSLVCMHCRWLLDARWPLKHMEVHLRLNHSELAPDSHSAFATQAGQARQVPPYANY